jgi:hypothetical protein
MALGFRVDRDDPMDQHDHNEKPQAQCKVIQERIFPARHPRSGIEPARPSQRGLAPLSFGFMRRID